MRVIAGTARGLRLDCPAGVARPMMDRVRGAVFSSLGEQGLIRSDADLFTLDNVIQAYEALHHGHLRGRAVVTPND